LTIFEVDRPGLFAHKEQVLDRLGARPACRRQTVAADPHGSWVRALIRRGWDAARPTAFLPNGLDYVSNGSADRLVRQITAVAAAGSWIGFAINSEATRRSPFFTAFIAKQQVLGFPQWTFGLDDPDAWLAAYGWTSTSIVVGAPEANYGRWPLQYVPREIPAVPRTFLTEGWRGREETRCESQ
jgi:methyltransferase (TIGR00027 family)